MSPTFETAWCPVFDQTLRDAHEAFVDLSPDAVQALLDEAGELRALLGFGEQWNRKSHYTVATRLHSDHGMAESSSFATDSGTVNE